MTIRNHAFIVLAAVLGVSVVLIYLTTTSVSSRDKGNSFSPGQEPAQAQQSIPVSGEVTPTGIVNTPAKNGSSRKLTQTVTYRVPRDTESITVELTVSNGIVTSLMDTNSGSNPESAGYQQRFESEIRQYVVGKSLSSISLSRVGGASMTTAAFMRAVSAMQTM